MASLDLKPSESNQPNREELLQLAIRAAKAGQRDGARVMFRQILSEDKKNERAMMWMAKLASTKKERVQWLNRILAVNPENSSAKESLDKIIYTEKASQNRTLLMVGVVAAVLIIIAVLAIVTVLLLQ
jgi:cytochrome c-type biogenesis protein CcmH/NrfG